MKQYLIEFEHDSDRLGINNIGMLLVRAKSFTDACQRVFEFKKLMKNNANGYEWEEQYTNPHNFVNLTID